MKFSSVSLKNLEPSYDNLSKVFPTEVCDFLWDFTLVARAGPMRSTPPDYNLFETLTFSKAKHQYFPRVQEHYGIFKLQMHTHTSSQLQLASVT